MSAAHGEFLSEPQACPKCGARGWLPPERLGGQDWARVCDVCRGAVWFTRKTLLARLKATEAQYAGFLEWRTIERVAQGRSGHLVSRRIFWGLVEAGLVS